MEVLQKPNADVQLSVETLSVDEAAERIRNSIPEAQTAQRQLMESIWKWGNIVALVEKPWGERVNIYKELNEKTGIHFNLLRQYEALYDQFLGRKESFDRFLAYYEKSNLLRVNFSNVSNVLRLLDKVEPEFREDILARNVETAVRRVADLNDRAREEKVHRESAESIALVLDEEYEDLKHKVESGEKVFADNTPRSEKHLAIVRSNRCILSPTCDCKYKDETTHAHHTQEGGKGIVGSDYSAIPLCPRSHQFWHDHGRDTFEAHYQVLTSELVADMLHRRVSLQPLYVKFDLSKDVQ